MKNVLRICVLAAFAVPALAQDGKPPAEMDVLKKLEGDWLVTMKMAGMENKGTMTWKSELGGMWVSGSFECEAPFGKFTGKAMDSYDPTKKKYVNIWLDSMSAGQPMMMSGDYDKEKKTMTLTGEGPGSDGKPTKYKSTSEWADADTINFSMWMGEGKDPAFTIVYKRKK